MLHTFRSHSHCCGEDPFQEHKDLIRDFHLILQAMSELVHSMKVPEGIKLNLLYEGYEDNLEPSTFPAGYP